MREDIQAALVGIPSNDFKAAVQEMRRRIGLTPSTCLGWRMGLTW